jgi:hypothetical protein
VLVGPVQHALATAGTDRRVDHCTGRRHRVPPRRPRPATAGLQVWRALNPPRRPAPAAVNPLPAIPNRHLGRRIENDKDECSRAHPS